MKRTNWDLILITLASIGTIASIVVLIISASSVMNLGVTAFRILGLVGVVISLIICISILGILIKNYRANKVHHTQIISEN